MSIMETTLKKVNDKPTIVFSRLPFKTEATSIERVGIDYIQTAGSEGKSQCMLL